MKTSEIEIGTEYAVSRYGCESKATVLDKGEYTVARYTRYGTRNETIKKGINVDFGNHTEWVTPQQVKATWADYSAARVIREEREQSIRDYQDDLIARVAQITGDNYGVGRNYHGQPGFHIDTLTLRKLIEAAEAK